MSAQYKDYAVVGKIIPFYYGTRLRVEPSTYTHVINSYDKDSQVEIDLVREFIETVQAEYVRIGDKWGRVTKINGVAIAQPAWMAITYLGGAICRAEYVLASVPPVEPPVPAEKEKILSLTVISHYPDGSSVTDDFVRAV